MTGRVYRRKCAIMKDFKIRGYLLCILLLLTGYVYTIPVNAKTVAMIGDREYTKQELESGFSAYLEYQGIKGKLNAADSLRIFDQYWEELIRMYIYDSAIKAGKITISSAELEQEITNNPPLGVRQIMDLHTNGSFDIAKYQQALQNNPNFKESVMEHTRDAFGYQKLIAKKYSEASINEDSIRAEWFKENTTASASIIYFDHSILRNVNATDAETYEYYNQNLEQYKRYNGRSLYFVRLMGPAAKESDAEDKRRKNKELGEKLYTLAQKDGLHKAAAKLGLTVQETPMFSPNDGFIRMIGREPSLLEFAFSHPRGSLSELITSLTGDYLLCEVANIAKEYYSSFEYEKGILQIMATALKRRMAMKSYVQQFMQEENPETYMQRAIRDSIRIVNQDVIRRSSSFAPIGFIEPLNIAILNTPAGSYTPLVEHQGLHYLALVTQTNTPELEQWSFKRDSILEKAKQEAQESHLESWLASERSKLKLSKY